MALEDLFRRIGFRKDPTAQDPAPASIQVFSNYRSGQNEHGQKPTSQELAQYPGLEQYPAALAYLRQLGVSLADIQAVYPEFEDYAESEFDDHGHAFRYLDGPYKHYRLDRVIFPSDTYYPYMLAVDREVRYAPHRGHSLGAYTLPERRIRMNVYPDTSVSLHLQTATPSDLTNFATYFVSPEGNVEYSERAMRDSHFLHDDDKRHEERPVPQRLDAISDPHALQMIPYFAEEYLEQAWDLTAADIAIPSAELAQSILTAPTELGVNLKAMLDY